MASNGSEGQVVRTQVKRWCNKLLSVVAVLHRVAASEAARKEETLTRAQHLDDLGARATPPVKIAISSLYRWAKGGSIPNAANRLALEALCEVACADLDGLDDAALGGGGGLAMARLSAAWLRANPISQIAPGSHDEVPDGEESRTWLREVIEDCAGWIEVGSNGLCQVVFDDAQGICRLTAVAQALSGPRVCAIEIPLSEPAPFGGLLAYLERRATEALSKAPLPPLDEAELRGMTSLFPSVVGGFFGGSIPRDVGPLPEQKVESLSGAAQGIRRCLTAGEGTRALLILVERLDLLDARSCELLAAMLNRPGDVPLILICGARRSRLIGQAGSDEDAYHAPLTCHLTGSVPVASVTASGAAPLSSAAAEALWEECSPLARRVLMTLAAARKPIHLSSLRWLVPRDPEREVNWLCAKAILAPRWQGSARGFELVDEQVVSLARLRAGPVWEEISAGLCDHLEGEGFPYSDAAAELDRRGRWQEAAQAWLRAGDRVARWDRAPRAGELAGSTATRMAGALYRYERAERALNQGERRPGQGCDADERWQEEAVAISDRKVQCLRMLNRPEEVTYAWERLKARCRGQTRGKVALRWHLYFISEGLMEEGWELARKAADGCGLPLSTYPMATVGANVAGGWLSIGERAAFFASLRRPTPAMTSLLELAASLSNHWPAHASALLYKLQPFVERDGDALQRDVLALLMAMFQSIRGEPAHREVEGQLVMIRSRARPAGSFMRAFVCLAHGVTRFYGGRWGNARESFLEFFEVFAGLSLEARLRFVPFLHYACDPVMWGGNRNVLEEKYEICMREARRVGDRSAQAMIDLRAGVWLALAKGDPDEAKERILRAEMLLGWTSQPAGCPKMPMWEVLFARARVSRFLYVGDADAALTEAIALKWRNIGRFQRLIPATRCAVHWIHGSAAAASLSHQPEEKRLLLSREIDADGQVLGSLKGEMAAQLAGCVQIGHALARDQRSAARHVADAMISEAQWSPSLIIDAALVVQAKLRTESRGDSRWRQALKRLKERGIEDPYLMMRTIIPAFR